MDDRLSSVSVAGNFTSPAATMGGDVVLSIFRAFATLNGFQAEPALGFAENGDWSGEIVSRAMQSKVGLVVLPWDLQGAMMDGIEGLPMGNSGIEISATPASQVGVASTGRFDYFFDPGRKGSFSGQVTPAAGLPAPAGAGTTNPAAAAARRNKAIVDSVLRLAYERCPVAVLIDRGFGVALGSSNVISASEEHLDVPLDPDPTMDAAAPGSASTAASTKHKVRRAVVLAFFGGQDDREAAAVALRLSADLTTVVSVLRIKTGPKSVGGKVGKRTDSEAGNGEAVKVAETEPTTEEQVEPAVAGQSADPKPSPVSEDDAAIALLAGRANVSIEEISGAATAVSRVSQLGGRDLVVLGRNAPGISNLLPVSRPLSTSSIASRSLSWLKRPVDTPGLGAGAGAGAGAALTGTSLSVLGELSDRLLAGSTQISADVCIKASVLVVQSRYPALTGSVA